MDSFQTVSQIRRLLDSKQFSAVELCGYYLDRISKTDKQLNSFVAVEPERVIAKAKSADRAIAQREAKYLTGIPIAHKDIFCVRGRQTSCCSNILRTFIAPYDATIVANIAQSGGIYFGKTNMDEFAMGTSNRTSVWGPVLNPWDFDRVPGGSSGGSAAAVAAGLVPVATGSDTGGSIRQPAAFCGITGFKPTYGRVSRYGMVAFASSLDQAGTLTLTADDAALLFQIMQGSDRNDATSVGVPVSKKVTKHYPLTFGYSSEQLTDLNYDLVAPIEATRTTLERMGHTFIDIGVFDPDLAFATYYVISCAEASSNLARFDGIRFGSRTPSTTTFHDLYESTRSNGFGPEVKKRLLAGTYFLTSNSTESHLKKAQRIRRAIFDWYEKIFQQVDIILAPTTPSTAFRLNEQQNSTNIYRQDRFTVPVNLCGLPGISVPVGLVEGLPTGVQFIGPRFGDELVLDLAIRFQQETDWHQLHPPL